MNFRGGVSASVMKKFFELSGIWIFDPAGTNLVVKKCMEIIRDQGDKH